MDKLVIHLLGNAELFVGSTLINPKLSTKSIAIIALLLCNESKKIAREKIAYMLWSDCYDTAAYNLRYNLWNIKKNIPKDEDGHEFIISTKKYSYVNPKYSFESDINFVERIDFENESNNINLLESALKQFRGNFLEDFYIKDGDDFNDWVFYQREKYQKRQLKILDALLNGCLEQNNYNCAKNILEKKLYINPYDEEAHFNLMNIYINNNEINLAILQYKKCEAILREELNVLPEKKLKKLYLSIISDKSDKNDMNSDNFKKNIVIRLNENSDETIDYFIVSDLVEKLISSFKKSIIFNIPKNYWEDVSTIQPCVINYLGKLTPTSEIKDIRLFYSLKYILQQLFDECYIQILIYNEDKIDRKSRSFLKFIEFSTKIYIKYIKK